jgi:cyclopropane fatty-acyl-phospholipid synthase-like methyltransferase
VLASISILKFNKNSKYRVRVFSPNCPYRKDLENYIDHGEISEDWCPEEVTSAILTWIRSNVQPDEPILSIGCGNGTLLLQLVSKFF